MFEIGQDHGEAYADGFEDGSGGGPGAPGFSPGGGPGAPGSTPPSETSDDVAPDDPDPAPSGGGGGGGPVGVNSPVLSGSDGLVVNGVMGKGGPEFSWHYSVGGKSYNYRISHDAPHDKLIAAMGVAHNQRRQVHYDGGKFGIGGWESPGHWVAQIINHATMAFSNQAGQSLNQYAQSLGLSPSGPSVSVSGSASSLGPLTQNPFSDLNGGTGGGTNSPIQLVVNVGPEKLIDTVLDSALPGMSLTVGG